MKERPEALADADIRRALGDGWGISSTVMRYVPLGGGSYHCDVEATDRTRWFVSATDFDDAPWLGTDRGRSLLTLQATMNTARTLRDELGLSFVLSPVPCSSGEVVRVVRERYGLVVHPYLHGSCGEFGAPLHPADLSAVVDIVAALHASNRSVVDLHQLADLEAREALRLSGRFGSILDRYDELGAHVTGRSLVVTHGEPHAGNLMRADTVTYLIDWDTAALALPERDLWLLHDHGNTEVLRLYEDRTGHLVDPEALAFYRLRWRVEELVGAVRDCDAAAIEAALTKARTAAGLA